MKYIKHFEKTFVASKRLYNDGDYVKLKRDENYELVDNAETLGQVTGYYQGFKYPYSVRFYNGVIFEVLENEIIRLLTSDEIDEYNAKKDSLKYNI